MDVAILSLVFNVTGLNLQAACNHGVCLSFYFNPSHMRQAFARIHRIWPAQDRVLDDNKADGSYSEIQERTVHVKQARFYAAQADIPPQVLGDLRDIICFELAREEWGTLESTFVWAREAQGMEYMIVAGNATTKTITKLSSL